MPFLRAGHTAWCFSPKQYCPLPIAFCSLLIASCPLPTPYHLNDDVTNCPPPTPHWLLPIADCSLPVSSCLICILPISYCMLLTAHCFRLSTVSYWPVLVDKFVVSVSIQQPPRNMSMPTRQHSNASDGIIRNTNTHYVICSGWRKTVVFRTRHPIPHSQTEFPHNWG